MITFQCECGKRLQAREDRAGKAVACPACGATVTIPPATAVRDSAPPPSRAISEAMLPRRTRPGEDDRGPAGPQHTSSLALFSLIAGLASFCVPFIGSIAAVVLGFMGLSEVKNSGGRVKGSGLAVGGIVTGMLSGLLGLVGIPLAFWLASQGAAKVEEARKQDAEAAKAPENVQSRHNLRQIGLAFHNYDAMHAHMPPAVVYGQDGRPLYSWRVLLLPYLEQEPLFRAFRFDEPWDSPHNIQFATQMPGVFAHPGDPGAAAKGLTYYQVFVSEGSEPVPDRPIFTRKKTTRQVPGGGQPLRQPIFAAESLRLVTIRDGASNTLLLAEAANPVPWTKPEDMSYSPKLPVPRLGLTDRKTYNVVMADGAVLEINPARLREETLRRVITANDGNVIMDWPPP